MLVKRLILISAVITALGGVGLLSGIICNKLVIDANGGKMPIVPKPGYEELAKAFCEGSSTYKIADENTKLVFLADRFHQMEDGILISTYSLGDILIRVGNLVFDLGFVLMLGFLVILVFRDKK